MLFLLCIVFIASGAAGLIYESIWTRYLGLFVGHSAYAQVLVLVMFLGGMSIGALLMSRNAERIRRPLLWYAIVELMIGLLGLLFHDAFLGTTHWAYDTLFPAIGPGVGHSIAKWVLAALLILPQSILLGATFPLMTTGAIRRLPQNMGRTVSLLYFANSLGASVGVLFAGFVLIEMSGLPGTLAAAAMLNLVVAASAMIAEVRFNARNIKATLESGAPVEPVPVPAFAPSDAPIIGGTRYETLKTLLLVVAFGTAVSSFVYEIGWIRMLSLVLGAATHSFELMLSAFILGLSLGSYYIRRRVEGERTLLTLGWVQIAMGALAVATLPLYVDSFQWMADFMAAFSRSPAGYRAFSMSRYAICLVVMLPATFCAGMTLPLITRLLMRGPEGEKAIGLIYSVNTLGSILGVIIASMVLLPLLGLKWMLVAGAAIDVAIGLLVLTEHYGAYGWRSQRRVWLPAFCIVAVLFLAGSLADFDHGMMTSGVFRYGAARKAGVADMVFYADGRTATVSVRRIQFSHGLSLATNGKPDASLGPEWFAPPKVPGPFTHDASTQTLLPLILLAHNPAAKDAAVIGMGSGMSTHTILLDDQLKSLVTIEIEPEMIRAAAKFYPANKRAFEDPRNQFAFDDARSFFASRGQRYDLILSEPSTPWVAGVSGLFTTEFYAHVRRYLAPHGVFGQWLHLTEINDGLVLSVVRALAENFKSYTIYAVGNRDMMIIGSMDSVPPTPDWSVFQRRDIADALRRVYPLTPAILDALHVADGQTFAPLIKDLVANSDFFPTLDLGAEKSRYVNEGANGFVGIVSDRFAIAPMLESRRVGVATATYTPLNLVPKLEAMELAARWKRGFWTGATPIMLNAAERTSLTSQLLKQGEAPIDWHVWASAVRDADEVRSGGTSGVADSALYADADRYMNAHDAPSGARATVAFLHGLAAWDFAEASRSADVLIENARRGELWLPADELREGVVVARLKIGDVDGAKVAMNDLARYTVRDPNDVRVQLLDALVKNATKRTAIVR